LKLKHLNSERRPGHGRRGISIELCTKSVPTSYLKGAVPFIDACQASARDSGATTSSGKFFSLFRLVSGLTCCKRLIVPSLGKQASTRTVGFFKFKHWRSNMDTSFYSLTLEIGRGVFSAFVRMVDRDDARVPADLSELIIVLLFVAIGLLLTAAFFILGFGVEFGQTLAVST
jgi:hypothetical protein